MIESAPTLVGALPVDGFQFLSQTRPEVMSREEQEWRSGRNIMALCIMSKCGGGGGGAGRFFG